MKTRLKFQVDKDLLLAIVVGVCGSLVALAMFFLSGYMVTQSALGAPLYALMILVVTVKLFGFLRAITRYVERLISHKATFTMLRDIRVQFFGKLVNVIPNVYRKLSSSDLISRMISRVEALQKYIFTCLLSTSRHRFDSASYSHSFGVHFNRPCAIDYG